MTHVWDFSPVWEYRQAILRGALVTLWLSILASLVGTALGLALAEGLTSRDRRIYKVITVIVELGRACPPFVVLLWAYYLLPMVAGAGFSAFQTALVSFTLIFACFAADIFRGAISDIPRETLDSGRMVGMSPETLRRRIVIPEIFRRSLPAINGHFVNMLKMSSLASVISVGELTYQVQMVNVARPKPLEIYTATAALYIAMILPLVWILRKIESLPACRLNPAGHVPR